MRHGIMGRFEAGLPQPAGKRARDGVGAEHDLLERLALHQLVWQRLVQRVVRDVLKQARARLEKATAEEVLGWWRQVLGLCRQVLGFWSA